jgi:hypothetical protein
MAALHKQRKRVGTAPRKKTLRALKKNLEEKCARRLPLFKRRKGKPALWYNEFSSILNQSKKKARKLRLTLPNEENVA